MPRTAKQVLAEQQKQAERDRAQQAQSVMVIKPALPASLDHRSPRERYLDECAPSGVVGRLVKFGKDGKFTFADDGEAISESDDFVALADQTLVSWVKFGPPGSGEPPKRIGGLLYQGFVLPPRPELGDTDQRQWPNGLSGQPEDPWKHEQLLVLRRPTTLELLTFSTMSKTGRRAVGNLLKHFDRLQQATPGAFPVVRLKPSGYEDSRFGWVPTPLFVVVGMIDSHSPVVPDTSLKAQMNDAIPF